MLGFLTVPLAASDTSSGSSPLGILLFLLPMGLIFYFLLIRPQQRQRRAHRELIESVDVGDEVVTIGGVYGTVRAMDEESLTLEVAPGIDMRFARGAVARKLVYDEYEDEDGDDADDEDQSAIEDGGEAEPVQTMQDGQGDPWLGRGTRRRGRRGRGAGESS